jgi:hypothetical protein
MLWILGCVGPVRKFAQCLNGSDLWLAIQMSVPWSVGPVGTNGLILSLDWSFKRLETRLN